VKKLVVILTLVCSSVSASEFQTSVGIGHQYGGLIGAQFGYKTDDTKLFGSVGFFGAALGYQTLFQDSNNLSYGLVLGAEALKSEDGFLFMTSNYHFNGFDQSGWVIGAGVGVSRQDQGGFYSDTPNTVESDATLTLSIGYDF
jgi:hypothetical protein